MSKTRQEKHKMLVIFQRLYKRDDIYKTNKYDSRWRQIKKAEDERIFKKYKGRI